MKTRKHKTKQKQNITKKIKITGLYKTPPKIEKINGYRVLFLPQSESNLFYISCNIFGGFYIEKENELGASHLLEHLVLTGWRKCKIPSCYTLTKLGVQLNALTTHQHTQYHTYGLPIYADTMIDYLTSIVISPKLTQEGLTREKFAVKTELLKIMKTSEWKISKEAAKLIYNSPKYYQKVDIVKILDQLKTLTLPKLKTLFEKVHTKDCMLITVTGKYRKNNIIKILKQRLPKNTTKCIAPCQRPISNTLDCYTFKGGITYIKNKKSKSTQLYMLFPTNMRIFNDKYVYSDFICNILAKGVDSILLKHLRFKLKLLYGISIKHSVNLCGSIFIINTTISNKNTFKVMQEIIKQLTYYATHLVDAKILASALNKYITYNINFCKNSLNTANNYYINQYFLQLGSSNKKILTIKDKYNKIKKITPEIIRTCIKEWFNINYLALVYYGSEPVKYKNKNITYLDLIQSVQ